MYRGGKGLFISLEAVKTSFAKEKFPLAAYSIYAL